MFHQYVAISPSNRCRSKSVESLSRREDLNLENTMKRTFLLLFLFVICGTTQAAHDDSHKGKPKVTTLSDNAILEKLDGAGASALTPRQRSFELELPEYSV